MLLLRSTRLGIDGKKKKASHLLGYSPTDGAVKGARLINVATHGGVYVQMTPSVE